VGYRTPAALHGLQVVSRITALRTAEVRLPDARAERALRSRPGIRFAQRVVPRVQADAPIPFAAGLAVPEWQWNAVHADLVPTWVEQAASSITIAETQTITGGTGRFAGASGSIMLSYSIEFATGSVKGSYTGTIDLGH